MKPILEKLLAITFMVLKRMNNHITESRSGLSTCKLPIHVFKCIKRSSRQSEELFFLYIRHTLAKK